MSKRKPTRRFERLESRVLPAFSTQLLALLGTNNANLDSVVNVNGTLFFAADNGTGGFELWKSNGTALGTVLVRDINPGASNAFPLDLTNINGMLFFSADNGDGNGQQVRITRTV